MKRIGYAALLAALISTGCIAVGGSKRFTQSTPTLGQELRDLRDARDCGAITDEEYTLAKSRLIRGGHGD